MMVKKLHIKYVRRKLQKPETNEDKAKGHKSEEVNDQKGSQSKRNKGGQN
jgi:hypothetical protein